MKTVEYQLERRPTMQIVDKETQAPLMPRALQDYPMIGLGLSEDGMSKVMICFDPTEDSIYLNKHRNPDPSKKTIEKIVFEYFRCRMTFASDSDTKKKFMDAWLYNKGANGAMDSGIRPLFHEVDHEAIADAATRAEQVEDRAKNLVWDATDEEVLAYASYKDVRSQGGMKSLRRVLRRMIPVEGAQKFIDEFKSDMVKRSYIFTNLIEEKVLINDKASGTIKWGSSGDPIHTYGSQNPIEALVNHSLRGEGARFWDVIVRDFSEEEVEMDSIAKKSTSATVSSDFEMSVKDMVELGIKESKIKEGKKGGFYFGGSKCGATVETTVSHIQAKPEKINLLKQELGLV